MVSHMQVRPSDALVLVVIADMDRKRTLPQSAPLAAVQRLISIHMYCIIDAFNDGNLPSTESRSTAEHDTIYHSGQAVRLPHFATSQSIGRSFTAIMPWSTMTTQPHPSEN